MREPRRWDVFCRVVDNFGDAGVCWRLANLLTREHGARVRLAIDDLATLARLHPDVRQAPRQVVDRIEILHWSDALELTPDGVDVIVDAFGCAPPERYLEAAAAAERPPVWIVLEYLSAETWVSAHHGLPSPHPRLALERYFFFPGFTAETGGLLREHDLLSRRDAYSAQDRERFWASLAQAVPNPGALAVLMFAYPFAPLESLFDAWAVGGRRVVALVPESGLTGEALRFFGVVDVPDGNRLVRGSLEVRFVPFVPQARFDELLWVCDIAFVRGEDSVVRAQWAAKPFVWHVYAQAEDAHRAKLEALLDVYAAGLPPAAAESVRALSYAWNQLGGRQVSAGSAWAAFARELPTLQRHGHRWAQRLAASGELAANLARFCRDKLK